ncbi:MAG TPA: structural protein P5 [Candidatus Paceibacterota bacterium]
MTPTRGERNNNPGNIERGTIHWQGMADDQSGDKRFIVFNTPEDGIRALAKLLFNYQNIHGLNTVRQIVNRWAPPTENDTYSYVNTVASEVGVTPDDKINLTDSETLAKLVTAIIRHENGRVIYAESMIGGVTEALA